MSSAEKSATDLVITDESEVRAPGAMKLSLRRETVSVFRTRSGLRAGLGGGIGPCSPSVIRVCAPSQTGVSKNPIG